ncbi:MAG TPA: tetratricopeptide repeat protein [Desulfomonilaceae bacterium]|nr:tetratricopeptide repeat protein [Desulfomonilaceae bacterium]
MKKQIALISLIIIIVVAVYGPNLPRSFTNWDFQAYERILYSTKLLETSWDLFSDFKGQVVSGYYAPLSSVSLMLDKYVAGSQVPIARATILINLIIHCINGLILFYLVRAVGASAAVSAITMFIFLVHPMQVASILWPIQRKTVMGAMFYFASFLFYLHHKQSGSTAYYAASLCMFLLSLLSKPTAVTLPLALILTEALIFSAWTQRNDRESVNQAGVTLSGQASQEKVNTGAFWHHSDSIFLFRALWRVAPFLLIALIFGLLTTTTETTRDIDLPLIERSFIAASAIWFYLLKFFAPINLVAIYPRWSFEISDLLWWIPLVGLVIAGVMLIRLRRRVGNLFLWGLGNFLVSILPVIGLMEFGYFQHAFVADHFLYIGLAGLAFCTAIALERSVASVSAALKYAIAGLALIFLAFLTVQTFIQTRMWQNSTILWTRTLEHNPTSWTAHHNLGGEMLQQGRLAAAEEHIRRSLEIKPNNARAYNDLGNIFAEKGDMDEAVKLYRKALELRPDYPDAHNHLGAAFAREGRVDEAMEQFQQAIKLDPDNGRAYNNIGWTLKKSGRIEEAAKYFEMALQKEPQLAEAHMNLGELMEAAGKMGQAMSHYEDAVKFRPDYPEAYYDLANALLRSKRVGEAISHYQKALELKPNFPEAHNNLGAAYLMADNPAAAVPHFQEALKLQPEHERARLNLERALDKLRKSSERSENLPQPRPE